MAHEEAVGLRYIEARFDNNCFISFQNSIRAKGDKMEIVNRQIQPTCSGYSRVPVVAQDIRRGVTFIIGLTVHTQRTWGTRGFRPEHCLA